MWAMLFIMHSHVYRTTFCYLYTLVSFGSVMQSHTHMCIITYTNVYSCSLMCMNEHQRTAYFYYCYYNVYSSVPMHNFYTLMYTIMLSVFRYMHAYKHANIHACIHTHLHTYTPTHLHIHTHLHKHTHTNTTIHTLVFPPLQALGHKCAFYHGQMESEHRSQVQRRWSKDEIHIICATVAFGMGINKPDVRFVIHHSMPKSIEGFHQESGRAGRDNQLATCLLLYTYADYVRKSTPHTL